MTHPCIVCGNTYNRESAFCSEDCEEQFITERAEILEDFFPKEFEEAPKLEKEG